MRTYLVRVPVKLELRTTDIPKRLLAADETAVPADTTVKVEDYVEVEVDAAGSDIAEDLAFDKVGDYLDAINPPAYMRKLPQWELDHDATVETIESDEAEGQAH